MKNKNLVIGCSVAGGIVLLIIIGLVSWGISTYNGLVSMNEHVNESWSQVENQYQRRADLIPNLVNTVKGYANFEKSTLVDVTNARAKVSQLNVSSDVLNNPQAFQKFEQAQSQLGGALSRLLVTVERYPNLKANQSFLDLQAQLEGTENRIAVERRRFNEVVQTYDTRIKSFPASTIAGMYGFGYKQYFKSVAGAQTPPKVQF
jgi:LemA protein